MAARRSLGYYKRSNWQYFRKDLGTNTYFFGDAYQDEKREDVIRMLKEEGRYWIEENKPEGEYLAYVKSLAGTWPQLQLLVDFMEVGTIPTRWCTFPGEVPVKNQKPRYVYGETIPEIKREQFLRAKRMNVALLEYKSEGKPSVERYQFDELHPHSALAGLEEAVSRVKDNSISRKDIKLSLFVVEDLSRDIIETLGAGLDIDPRFFRTQLIDYVWNNVRDPWREPPMLDVMSRQRNWFQMRLVRSRYFPNHQELSEAQDAVDRFNVMRRMDGDDNQAFWDKDPAMGKDGAKSKISKAVNGSSSQQGEAPVDAKVGHIRSRATFWLRNDIDNDTAVAVLLLEPTPQQGYPLWRGYANWDKLPLFSSPPEDIPLGPPSMRKDQDETPKSWLEDFVFWAQKETCFPRLPSPSSPTSPLVVPVQALLHLVCTDWLTFTDYLNARLNQIDWEISRPAFLPVNDDREPILNKLNIWRRWVPVCRDMLSATLRQASDLELQQKRYDGEAYRIDTEAIFEPYRRDYERIQERLNDYEVRIDRLSTVVNNAISLEDARNTAKNSESVGNLTVLASLFVPPSLVASLLAMNTEPLKDLDEALKWWVVASFGAILLLFALYHTMRSELTWKVVWKTITKTTEKYAKMVTFTTKVRKRAERDKDGSDDDESGTHERQIDNEERKNGVLGDRYV
ncbi:hypothetical protein Neosp_009988 [[Neocosmospora] mangrovei]